jgi:hypothetical protein
LLLTNLNNTTGDYLYVGSIDDPDNLLEGVSLKKIPQGHSFIKIKVPSEMVSDHYQTASLIIKYGEHFWSKQSQNIQFNITVDPSRQKVAIDLWSNEHSR